MRFYFDYTKKDDSLYDYQGEDFLSTEAAYDFATATADTLKHSLEGDWLGWSIEVRNAEGKRYFSIPVGSVGKNSTLSTGDGDIAMVDVARGAAAAGPARLLIIEDVMTHGAVVDRVARKFGFATQKVHDCGEARRALEQQRFDCITLDLVLGEHIGLDILRYLSEIDCRTPIILISQADRGTCEDVVELGRALDLDMAEPIQKPIDLHALGRVFADIRTHHSTTRWQS
jgi:two-component system, chemotaxis family, chemotaxis protein CheY